MEFHVREATVNDAAAIARAHVASWRNTYAGILPQAYIDSLDVEARAEKWREQLAERVAITYVAEDATNVFGFVSGGALRSVLAGRGLLPGYDAELYAIYLIKERQRTGIGRALVLTLARALQKQGYGSMAVWVLQQNPAVRFYESLGAIQILEKSIQIGSVELAELAFGWPDLRICPAGRA